MMTTERLTPQSAYEKRPKKWIYNLMIFAVFIGVIVYSFLSSNIDVKRGINWERLQNLGSGFLNPNLDFLLGRGESYSGSNFVYSVPYLTLQTIAIAFIGTIIASILAIPFGFITARNVVGKKVSKIGEILLIIIRTFPEVLLALILIRVSGVGALTGTIVIGIHSVGMIGKLYAEAIENMDNGPIEALDAVGASTAVKIRHGIFPQVLPDFLSTVLYRFDINVRTASVLGIVSAGGIGAPLIFASTNYHWSDLASIMYAIIIMVIVVDVISSHLRKKLI
ncbi:MAG: phosphonate ABC transporter, permease protein PhnE [Bacilli bacterium]|nr:phosphonate ABC transporter, permease protein PhnE [Bacilli bacterium]